MPDPQPTKRPATLLIASGLSALASVFLVVAGVLAVTANPNGLSAGIAAVLIGWGALVALGAVGLFRLKRWSRGLVVAAGLLHLASAANFIGSQPFAVIPAVLALVTVLVAAAPATRLALGPDDSETY